MIRGLVAGACCVLMTWSGFAAENWYRDAKFGVFVHWGLYAIPGQGEWAMYRDGIPPAEYAALAKEWNPAVGAEEAMVRAAVRGGARYMVFTTRHHDGFSLFDSKANAFNSMHTPAGRDHVRAYVEACRKLGVRVGFYYSLVDWRLRDSDPAAMKRQAWAELEQLMTAYGKIDVLWYDGSWHPEGQSVAAFWESEKLNASVRRWQPDILINDRAGTKEDFQTIEGRNIPRPPKDAKLWESCLTLQDDDWSFWGYCNHTAFRKTPEQILCQLIHCLELGGNLLVNVGPSGTGAVDPWQRDLLANVGDWIASHRDAVYASHPTEVAAKTPLAKGWSGNSCGFFTEADDRYYLFLHAWPGERTTFPHFTGRVAAVRLNGRDIPFELDTANRRLTLTGLPKERPDDICPVLELFKDKVPSVRPDRRTQMREDTLGLFIHWGLYAIPAVGEWHLWRDNVPLAEYNALTNRFAPPASFSPRDWVKLAKRMGARYAVLTTRHHDGFCLFDTKTTDFNSVRTGAHRDFVREFAEACRAEGLRVGFYFSIMNWQYYPRRSKDFDRTTWDLQVRTTHEALRELMTNYGQIDYLWYDGCRAPGGNDADYMERMWRIRDLNAMVRRLQPEILINDRSMTPEDYSTPEQSLAAPPPGRAWESCITVNGTWGYRTADTNWKSSETLFRSLLHCVRHGGNLLVNIGPRADGSVPEACAKALEGLGERIRECPESIYGAERNAQTEATREGGVVTRANGSYWFWALETNRLDGVTRMERRGPRSYRVAFAPDAKPCVCLGKRHDLDLKAGDAPVLGDTSANDAPPTGAVEPLDLPSATETVFAPPAGGDWKLEVGYVTADGFRDTHEKTVRAVADGARLRVVVPGKGLYARRLSPVWRAVDPKGWRIAGVFDTPAVAANFTEASVRAVFARDLVTEARQAAFGPVPADNDRADHSDVRLSYVFSAAEKRQGLAFARRIVTSKTARSVYAALGCDWWGAVYVNGREALGYGYGWKPRAFRLDLRAGDNEILVACHSGSGQHWFSFFVNADVAAEVKRVAPGPGYVCREYVPGEVRPTGFLAEFARRQAAGTTGQRMKIGYPFDQSMWEVAITNLHYANPVWRGEDRPYGPGEFKCPWVPYEQTGYMLDAMLRLSYLTDCPAIRADYLKSLEAVLANPAPDGKLGGVCPGFPGWPMTIFARSALARFQATGDRRILDAWVRHYNAFGAARRTWSKRDGYNIESMLAFNEYIGDKKVIEDAVCCFDRSYCCGIFRRDACVSAHGPTITEALKLPGILYLHTGDRQWLDLGLRSVDNLFKFHEQPDGLISANECTSGRDPGQGHEACVVADMLWSLGYYLQACPRAIDGDRMERIAYNALPGHSTKDFKRHQYMSFVNQAQVTPFSKCTHFAPRSKHMQYRHALFFECCLGNIQRAFPAFAMRMWLKDEKTDEPIAALHGPSKLSAKFKGVDYTFEEKTEYPFDDKVTFVFHAAKPLELTLTYRVPSWAKRADAGTFAKVRRVWKDGDTFETTFPSEVTFKTDRNWHWFTKGALTFAWPVPSRIVEENPGDDFSPLILTPAAPWNWALDTAKIAAEKPQAAYRPNGKYPFDEPPLTLEVPAVGMQEWRVFDCNKWMPDIPLFAHPSGEKATLKLVPYGATLARITAFPDVEPRKELVVPVAYFYDRKAYDYDPARPLADQKFGPEVDAKFNWGFLAEDNPPQRDPDDFYDLGAHFQCYRNKLAYFVFRIWSDEDGEATFVLGAAHEYQAFLDGREIARSVGLRDARWLAPDWFKGPVKKGYNYLTVKVATPSEWSNMRRDWGAKLQVFLAK